MANGAERDPVVFGPPEVPPGAATPRAKAAFLLGLVGESFANRDGTDRQEIISRCRIGEPVSLVPEPDNPHDDQAVKVCRKNGEQIGYLPSGSRLFHQVRHQIVSAAICDITGGHGRKRRRGVVLGIWVFEHPSDYARRMKEESRSDTRS